VAYRFKEIGIRKVLGASAHQVTAAILRKFALMVFLANLLAFPATIYLFNRWLNEFAYHISLNVLPFLMTGLATALVACSTVTVTALKAGSMNPVDSLRVNRPWCTTMIVHEGYAIQILPHWLKKSDEP